VADYPFTTTLPVSGMMPYEDILIQLVDLPPITADMAPPGISGALLASDIILVVFDTSSGDCLDQITESISFLHKKRVIRTETIQGVRSLPPERIILVGNRVDLPAGRENMEIIKELIPGGFRLITASALTGENLEELKTILFKTLDVIRIYSKVPGKEPDMRTPFVVRRGCTLIELAEKIHKDLARQFKFARVWGSARFGGQSVPKEYVLHDKDIVEINV
jgi:hypothetical protein